MKGIWKTTGLSWKEQAKVKRKIVNPVGDFAKGWHQELLPSDLLEKLTEDCLDLKKYIKGAMIAK